MEAATVSTIRSDRSVCNQVGLTGGGSMVFLVSGCDRNPRADARGVLDPAPSVYVRKRRGQHGRQHRLHPRRCSAARVSAALPPLPAHAVPRGATRRLHSRG